DPRGNVRWQARPFRIAVEDGVDELGVRFTVESRPPGEAPEKDRAEGEDVASPVERFAAGLLGRHVRRGSEERSLPRQRQQAVVPGGDRRLALAQFPGEAEIQ